jgi:alpha-L-fucosidase
MESIVASAALPRTAWSLAQAKQGVVTNPRLNTPIAPWFHRDGLGLFLHWGPCSVAEIEISWSMFESHKGKPNPYWPVEKYDALADRFDPQNFNPDVWMEAVAKAGFKYAVYITRHCDGYALWPSDYGDFGTKQKMHGRDLVGPFVDACRKHGMKVGFYYSPTDWHYNPPGWPHRAFPRRDPDFHYAQPKRVGLPQYVDMPLPEIQKYFEQFYPYVKGQVTELLTRYGKIDVLWWDGYDWPDGVDLHAEEMEAYCRKLQPGIVLNDRYVSWEGKRHYGDYNTELEAKDPSQRPPGAWEQCEQVCVGWSYRGPDAPCHPASYVIERLVRDRAWGGNYLPDFGPRADGTLAPAHYAICEKMAEWMKYGGVSVFDVDGGPYPEKSDAPVTIKGKTWYVHFLSRQQRTATLSGMPEPRSAIVLRTGEKASWKKDGDALALTLPGEPATDFDEVVELTW